MKTQQDKEINQIIALIFILFLFLSFLFFESKKINLEIPQKMTPMQKTQTQQIEVPDLTDLNELIEVTNEIPETNITETFFDSNVALIYIDENKSHYSPSLQPTYIATISLDSNTEIYSIDFTIVFDSTKIFFLNASIGFDARISGKTLSFKKLSENKVKVSIYSIEQQFNKKISNGEIATINFSVKSKGLSLIEFENINALDSNNNQIKIEGRKTEVSIN